MKTPIKLTKTVQFSGPLINASARTKFSAPANLRGTKEADHPSQVAKPAPYINQTNTSWNPQRWRACAWMLDLMDDMAQFAQGENLEITCETLNYTREICRADILHQATQEKD